MGTHAQPKTNLWRSCGSTHGKYVPFWSFMRSILLISIRCVFCRVAKGDIIERRRWIIPEEPNTTCTCFFWEHGYFKMLESMCMTSRMGQTGSNRLAAMHHYHHHWIPFATDSTATYHKRQTLSLWLTHVHLGCSLPTRGCQVLAVNIKFAVSSTVDYLWRWIHTTALLRLFPSNFLIILWLLIAVTTWNMVDFAYIASTKS